jgi:mRNA-degrading endonuclease RelE of RelBE toxin-antitoxin system
VERAVRQVCQAPDLGRPLGGALKGLRRRRLAGFRLIYRVVAERGEVWFYALLPRDAVYDGMVGRLED